jgi:formamidopyrimidine-DNA glycosylase
MPELPEVETVRRGIAAHVVGRTVSRVEVGRERTVRRMGREALIHGLSGATILSAQRRGKYLLCPLDSGEVLMIHLRMSGRVLIAEPSAPRPPHTHVVAHLAALGDAPPIELWFVDPRTFGEVLVFDPAHAAQQVPELARLGPDPLVDEFTPDILVRQLLGKRGALKAALLDQSVVAGIGNISADEILHRAGLRPRREPHRLSRRTIERLYGAIVEVLAAAVASGGSTLDDTQYVDVDGTTGSYQHEHRVYGRAGDTCFTCGRARISRTVVAGRTTCYCAVCQR